MKKATNSKLHFKKNDIAELSQVTMRQIAGGGDTNNGQTTLICGDCILVPGPIRNITKLQP
ncbi:class I lanthipeptide [Flavobacterium sp. CAU 1735]|uniref:class I lanthipeptide n=1 Tax=Flavobacterium sp. CAU 1735 TaxID=3140361 RepID=UPI0032609970